MICCGMEAVRNTVLDKEFYYCRECKQEVSPRPDEIISEAAYMEQENIYSGILELENVGLSSILTTDKPLYYRIGWSKDWQDSIDAANESLKNFGATGGSGGNYSEAMYTKLNKLYRPS